MARKTGSKNHNYYKFRVTDSEGKVIFYHTQREVGELLDYTPGTINHRIKSGKGSFKMNGITVEKLETPIHHTELTPEDIVVS